MKAREIAEFVGGELRGDGDVEIVSVSDFSTAGPAQIAFIEKTDHDLTTDASCFLSFPPGSDPLSIPDKNLVIVTSPKLAFARIAGVLHPTKYRTAEMHSTAVVSETATLGDEVFVGAFTCVGEESVIGDRTQIRAGAKIGDGVTVGRNCVLHPNVFIEDGCSIGNNVV